MNIHFNDLGAQWGVIKEECIKNLDSLFERSDFILGGKVKEFEDSFAVYSNSTYAVGVSNGTDALKLAAQSLYLEGRICFIIPANTFVATLSGVEQAYPNATFKLIDCDEYHQLDMNLLGDFLITERQYYDEIVIVPVHLYGYCCNMDKLKYFEEKYNCTILEDASQAHGSKYNGTSVGGFGLVSAFSLYPGKNLGAAGDAGIITTNDKEIYKRLLMLRNLGSVEKFKHEIRGGNHRLDTIQAIILNEKMKYIDEWNGKRRDVVKLYESKIHNKNIILPKTPPDCLPVHHIYAVLVKNRNHFTNFLEDYNIQWGIHYPICIEEMEMYKCLEGPNKKSLRYSKEMVSLPIHPFMKMKEILYICDTLNNYKLDGEK
tara:strand:- start:10866 stop:11987 length:1122 start_codon:yes stop_codon:yes gene_type:complete